MRINPAPFTQRKARSPFSTPTPAKTVARNLSFYVEPGKMRGSRAERLFNQRAGKLDLTEGKPLYHLLSFRTYILKQVLAQGFITIGDAYKLLLRSLTAKDEDIEGSWEEEQTKFIRAVIRCGPLARELPRLEGEMLMAAEFFLRNGAIGLYRLKSFDRFRRKLALYRIPPYLEMEYTKALWLEMRSLSILPINERLLFGGFQYDPSSAKYHDVRWRIWGSTNLSTHPSKHEGTAVDSVLRAEVGHWLEEAFEIKGKTHCGIMDELMDRANMINYSRGVDEENTISLYQELFSAYKELSELVLKSKKAKQKIERKLNARVPRGIKGYEEYFMKNAQIGLSSTVPLNDFHKKIIGEGIFYALRSERRLRPQAEKLIGKIKRLRKRLEKLPEDVRVFYEGDFFLDTHDFAYPGLSVPRAPILGEGFPAFGKDKGHQTAEWLNFMIKQRVGSLLICGLKSVKPTELYRYASLYLVYLFNQGATVGDLINVVRYLSEGEVLMFLGGICSWTNGAKYRLKEEAEDLERRFKEGKILFTTLFDKFMEWQKDQFIEHIKSGEGNFIYSNLPFIPPRKARRRGKLINYINNPSMPILFRRLAAQTLALRKDRGILSVTANDPIIWIYKLMVVNALAHSWENFRGERTT